MNPENEQTPIFSNEEEEDHCQYALQITSMSVLPMVLKSAMELGILQIMNTAGKGVLLSPMEIATRLLPSNTHRDASVVMIDRILRLLSSYSILKHSVVNKDGVVERLYGLAPVANYFIPDEDGASLAPLYHLIQDKIIIDTWYNTTDAVLEGSLPFNRTYGMNASEYVSKDDRFYNIFRDSMKDYNTIFMKKILKMYSGFKDLKSMVDVGGGNGAILNMIVSKYPNIIKAINFDLFSVIEKAPAYQGIQNITGDMFISIPKADAIFMKWILHGLDDSNCLKLLQNCNEALPYNGKVVIVELVVPEEPSANHEVRSKFQFDLFMMNMNPVGKERTGREFTVLANKAGFSSVRVMCCAYNFSVVEFYKKV